MPAIWPLAKNSETMNFWLKVKKEYIIENFDELLAYLRSYAYDADGAKNLENPDFRSTLECMDELSADLAEAISSRSLYDPEENRTELENAVRLLAATILAGGKCGRSCSKWVVRLVAVLAASRMPINEELTNKLWALLVGSMAGRGIKSVGFGWRDIEAGTFTLSLFAHRFISTELTDAAEPASLEGRGLLTVESTGAVQLFPSMNLADRRRKAVATEFFIPNRLNVDVASPDQEPIRNYGELSRAVNLLAGIQTSVKPSPTAVRKSYLPGSQLYVRVSSVKKVGSEYYQVTCETIDPAYSAFSARLSFQSFQAKDRPLAKDLFAYLRKGDILYAELVEDKGQPKFDISNTFEQFYRDYAAETMADANVWAIYDSEYGTGTQWITDDGIRVRVADDQVDDDDTVEYLEKMTRLNLPIALRTYPEVKQMALKAPFQVYAKVNNAFLTPREDEEFTRKDADEFIIDKFIERSTEGMTHDIKPEVKYLSVSPMAVVAMARMLWREHETFDLGAMRRLMHLGAAEMLMCLAGRDDDCRFLRVERSFLDRLVAFAQNETFTPLELTESAALYPNAERYAETIRVLAGYKNPTTGGDLPTVRADEDDAGQLQRISTLVDASNAIAGIVQTGELNNIKKAIAHELDVDDEYVSILSDGIFYGSESMTLEFKKSLVFPPKNRLKTAGATADIATQRQAILKAICAFLNSRAGGELLLGVNDGGYAEGVEDDINYMHRSKLISEPNIDHYILYIQRMVDNAFACYDSDVRPKDITSMYVTYTPEREPDGREILRIHVKPYPYGAVRLLETQMGTAEAYVRRSNSSVTMTPEMRLEVEKYKLRELHDGKSGLADMVKLRQAKEEHNIVLVKEYKSQSGTANREIEVYQLWEDRKLVYGYDTVKKHPVVLKASRWKSIELLPAKWTSPHCALTINLDPFDMRIDDSNAVTEEVLLTAYAAQLLREETYNANIQPNSGKTAREYPYKLVCRLSAYDGLLRFCMGLPHDVKPKPGSELERRLL